MKLSVYTTPQEETYSQFPTLYLLVLDFSFKLLLYLEEDVINRNSVISDGGEFRMLAKSEQEVNCLW